jgi:hypothetical protein
LRIEEQEFLLGKPRAKLFRRSKAFRCISGEHRVFSSVIRIPNGRNAEPQRRMLERRGADVDSNDEEVARFFRSILLMSRDGFVTGPISKCSMLIIMTPLVTAWKAFNE